MVLLGFALSLDALSRGFGINPEQYFEIAEAPNGLLIALAIVLVAGLSLAIGQSIVLFINRVRPVRFVFSLLITAILFAFGYLFLVLSTWLLCLLPWSVHLTFNTLARVFGLSYAPFVLGLLSAMPYFGVPILMLLSVAHLLAMVVGFSVTADVSEVVALGYVAFGWVVLQIAQQTIGQPIANLGRWLANTVAGTTLEQPGEEVLERLLEEFLQSSSPLTTAPSRNNTATQPWLQRARQTIQSWDQIDREQGLTASPNPSLAVDQQSVSKEQSKIIQQGLVVLALIGMVFTAYVVAVLLEPMRTNLFGWHDSLPRVGRIFFNLSWIGVVAIAFAALLAPLETLGWWAGWYNDEVDTTINTGTLVQPINDPQGVSRYVIYLDGISQSTSQYLPDIEDFLDALTPALPEDVALIRGVITYSVVNNPLDEDRPLAFLWRLADRMRFANPTSLLGLMVNLRNVLIVCVSADQRYGPLYNRGIAQILYTSLINNGYQLGSGVPVTLVGYSGGGQMSAASAPFLRRAIQAPIDVISLGGVISGSCNILKLEHLYHLVGDKDKVERLGPIMFPGRWKLSYLSYWNRAKRLGKISLISLGPVGHQVPGGMLDPVAYLPDGRSHLEQTVDYIVRILKGHLLTTRARLPRKPSNYELYRQAAFNRPDYYPLDQSVDPDWYRPIADWIGRLILPKPEERAIVRGVWFEVHHAPVGYESLIGQIVRLRWTDDPVARYLVQAARRDVHFNAAAEYTSEYGGLIHPDRLNHWRQVGPLESLAGSRPQDDMIVMLTDPVDVALGEPTILSIMHQPVQITGRYCALVKFEPLPASGDGRAPFREQFRVVHFNPATRQFDGLREVVQIPRVIADQNGCAPSTTHEIDRSPLNETGWYIYGAKDERGQFVVQSMAPRSLLRLQPDRVIVGYKPAYRYIRKQAWADINAQKGKVSSVLLTGPDRINQESIDEWKVGDRALLLHTYGGIGGKKKEPAAATPLFFGHFAYGLATVVQDPFTQEKRFEIQYYQVYTHNTDGIVAGTLHWSRYMGDRQYGWAGVRPVCDILIKFDAFTGDYEVDGVRRSPLNLMLNQLQVMTARYRVGDGAGGTYVGPANNCSQDSNQALFASLQSLRRSVESNADRMAAWFANDPDQARRFQQLLQLGRELQFALQPFGSPRSDWDANEYNLGSTLEDAPLRNLRTGLTSWRTLLPRLASDTIVRIFLKHNASVWVLRTTQIGGNDPDIEAIAPMTL